MLDARVAGVGGAEDRRGFRVQVWKPRLGEVQGGE
jgi:hypothetical protein